MLILVDPSAETPLYQQIAGSIRAQASSGSLSPGNRLPSARDLAEQLDVNLHTVLKAYQELRDEGIVALRRGRGAIITPQAKTLMVLSDDLDRLISKATALGVTGDALISLLRTQMATPASRMPPTNEDAG